MTTIWRLAETPVQNQDASGARLPYSRLMQRLLALRGFTDEAAIQKHLFPSLEHLHDPYLMEGIEKAQRLILSSVERRELMMVHGDYDADGITAAALLARTLEKLNAEFTTFLPDRKKDGYGVSPGAIRMAKAKQVKLLITADCGISAFREIAEARDSGMDVIVIDHHRIHEGKKPDATVVINPLQDNCHYPFKELSACGLAFKLAQALLGRGAAPLLDLVALSTVCDVAPLVDENRVLVHYGLEVLSGRTQPGFRALSEAAKLKRRRMNTADLGFILGPRINASGRMSSPDYALRLLTSNDLNETKELAERLDAENRARQQEERALLKQAVQMVERSVNFNRDRVIVVAGEGWHEGVIGIIAQRLVEQFMRPSVVIAFDGDKGKGSGRSLKGFHLFESFRRAEAFLEQFGGHELAAGLTIRKKDLDAFKRAVNQYAWELPADVFCRSIRIDLEIGFEELGPQFLSELSLLEPFGAGNPNPVFMTRGIETKRAPKQSGLNYLSWWVTDGTSTFEAQWRIRPPELEVPESGKYTLVYTPKIKYWDGRDCLVLDVRDVKQEGCYT